MSEVLPKGHPQDPCIDPLGLATFAGVRDETRIMRREAGHCRAEVQVCAATVTVASAIIEWASFHAVHRAEQLCRWRPVMPDERLVTRVVLRDYKSIAACDVAMAPVTFLVGRNGAGKTNFLNALRLVADGLRASLDHALSQQLGVRGILRRLDSGKLADSFEIRLECSIPDASIRYAFRVGASKENGGFEVQSEDCYIESKDSQEVQFYSVRAGVIFESSIAHPPTASRDRLYLVSASGREEFRPAYDALSSINIYDISPISVQLPTRSGDDNLRNDGRNVAVGLARIESQFPEIKRRIEKYMSAIVPGVTGVKSISFRDFNFVEFDQAYSDNLTAHFLAPNMSEGTLRALAILTALFQTVSENGLSRHLVGIEEPSHALHPAAYDALLDGIYDASHHTQIIATSHSPTLLDSAYIRPESILAVTWDQGRTSISPLDDVRRSYLKKQLFSLGELLTVDQLSPSTNVFDAVSDQVDLFGDEEV